jgi:RHS repeat-associated protein
VDPQGKTLEFGYDPEGGLTEVKRPGGIDTTSVFNEAGRLAETATSAGEPPVTLESLKYGYDPAGNVTSRLDRRLEQETTYAYDALGRLSEFNPPGEGATTYGYDKAGNRTEAGGTTYSYNALNQLTESSAGTTYSYDGAGRMTGMVNGSEKTTYEWEPLEHLAKVEGPGGTESYAYDGLERLSERKAGAETSVLHYGDLSDMPSYLSNGEGETTRSYVQGARGLVEQRAGEATSFPLTDAHGDITAITGPTGGVESRQEYGPWGEQLSGSSLEMGYLGAFERRADSATGLIQMGARSYGPALGAFASEDPLGGTIGNAASQNHYPYAWDDPIGRADLNGRSVCGTVGELLGGSAKGVCEDLPSVDGPGGKSLAEEGYERAPEFVKAAGTHTLGVCLGASAGIGAGVNGQVCVVGNSHGLGINGTLGAGLYGGAGAEVHAGGQFATAHSVGELNGPFASGGLTAGEGVRVGAQGSTGTGSGQREVNVYEPTAGVGVGTTISGGAGVSNTWGVGLGW